MLLFPELQSAALNLAVALVCGALIGTERQARQRTAGLRTNALVAIGAAAFVIFAARFAGEASPTRVAAQVVSGIGFLGAGIIFRDGFNVHGLNTAATLWCSAAVGLMAGTGAWHLAVLVMGFVVFTNLGMRPLVRWLKVKTGAEALQRREHNFVVRCRTENEAVSRAILLQTFSKASLHVSAMATLPTDEQGTIEIESRTSGQASQSTIDSVMQRLASEASYLSVRYQSDEEH